MSANIGPATASTSTAIPRYWFIIFLFIISRSGVQNSQFYEISAKKVLAEGLDNKLAHEIAISVWEQLPNPNIRNCVQIGRLVNEPKIEMAIADEFHNFKEYSVPPSRRETRGRLD
jgi:hypothetical protein